MIKAITYIQGFLPIIITAPHGGLFNHPVNDFLVERTDGGNKASDLNTYNLALEFGNKIKEDVGEMPHIVLANFHRKYIDANRPKEVNEPMIGNNSIFYDLYHQQIEDIITSFIGDENILLFDIHGQAFDSKSVLVGTNFGRTVNLPYTELKENILKKFEENLKEIDYELKYVERDDDATDDKYSGGFTVQKYATFDKVSGIQLEFGKEMREKENHKKVANAFELSAN